MQQTNHTAHRRDTRHLVALLLIFCLQPLLGSARGQADSTVTVNLPDGQSFEMVWIEGGTFIMGNNDAKGVAHSYETTRPEHSVTVGDFFMGRLEVTQGVWKAVMGENPSYFSGNDSLPVEQVSWDEARRFATLLSQMTGHRFRLPTEAEWEYAALGGNRSKGTPFAGTARGQLENYAWFCTNSDGHPHNVGLLLPNELGLYDMCGNVAEWCLDWMGPYTEADQTNPQGPREGDSRVLRGGYYNSTSSACAVFDRAWYLPSGKYPFYGLRLVMEAGDEN